MANAGSQKLNPSLPLVCFPVDELQSTLTRTHLQPHLDSLRDELTRIREEIDELLRPRSNEYPLGACEVIAGEMMRRLRSEDGLTALPDLQRFLEEGGRMRRVWGELRGQYFQTALQVGSLYVDVANDTVDISKVPVEILPLADSGFRNIESYSQFAAVAQTYWHVQCFPNLYLPNIAPYLPLFGITEDGKLSVYSSVSYIFVSNIGAGCRPARQLLESSWPTPPAHVVARMRGSSACDLKLRGDLAQTPPAFQYEVGKRLKVKLESLLNAHHR